MSKSPSIKNYGFSYDLNEKYFDENVDLGYGNSFPLFTREQLLQITVFEEMVDFDIFYRDSEKRFSPLRISLHDWQKTDTNCDRKFKKGKIESSTG